MNATHEMCLALLAWEWWLGHQNWIKARSTIALLILAAVIISDIIATPFRRGRS